MPLDRWLPPKPRTFAAAAGWACLLAAVVGCGDRRVEFQRNELLHTVAGLTEQQSVAIDTALLSLFGTADEPRLPTDVPELASLVEEDRLRQAGGPVISHEPGVTQGLYRRHCARCHGVTGDGRGPVARHLSPLPRDFRRGLFKWKSTYGATPPTDEDLHAVLRRGVPGTSMPSFARLSDSELATLVDYVKHLAVRGQTERALVEFVAEELAIEESPDLRGPQRDAFLGDWLAPIARSWRAADERVVTAPTAPTSSDAVEAGRELYHSERAGCVKCHGAAGQGGAVAGVDYPLDYDRWTRDLVEASAVADAETLLK
ncbi:MAG: cytochrome c, partial [Planctomycetota bacterium]